jgi:hypothetical protein
MDRETAIEFQKRIELVFKDMGPINEFLRPRLNADDFRTFAETWGNIICELDLGILEVIYRAYPDLRPNGMIPVTPLGAACGLRVSTQERDVGDPRPAETI